MSANNDKIAPVAVEVVTEPRQMRQFLALPQRIYASDPAWIAPLGFMKRERKKKKTHSNIVAKTPSE